MGAVAGSTIAAIIGTVEILKLRVRMVDVEMELAAAIGAVLGACHQQANSRFSRKRKIGKWASWVPRYIACHVSVYCSSSSASASPIPLAVAVMTIKPLLFILSINASSCLRCVVLADTFCGKKN